MNQTLFEILQSRQDLSDYVFHFTKHRNAKNTLQRIIETQSVVDINDRGYLCFSEAPLTSLPAMFDIFKRYPDPMYSPYGVGIKKDFFYQNGGRPVIYGDSNDRELLHPELLWRFEMLDFNQYDFSWLREWRIRTARLELNYNNCIAIVDTRNDIWDMKDIFLDFEDMIIDAEPEDGGCTTFYTGKYKRKFKVISMEDIKEINILSKQELNKLLEEQNEEEKIYLGSKWE